MVTTKEIGKLLTDSGCNGGEPFLNSCRLLQGDIPIILLLTTSRGERLKITEFSRSSLFEAIIDLVQEHEHWSPHEGKLSTVLYEEELLTKDGDDFHKVIERTNRITGETHYVYCTLQKNGKWVRTEKLNNYFRRIINGDSYKSDSLDYEVKYKVGISKPEVDLESRTIYVPQWDLSEDRSSVHTTHYFKDLDLICICHTYIGSVERNRMECYKINVSNRTGGIYLTRPTYAHLSWMDKLARMRKAAINPSTDTDVVSILSSFQSLRYKYKGDRIIINCDGDYFLRMESAWFPFDIKDVYYKRVLPQSIYDEVEMAKSLLD